MFGYRNMRAHLDEMYHVVVLNVLCALSEAYLVLVFVSFGCDVARILVHLNIVYFVIGINLSFELSNWYKSIDGIYAELSHNLPINILKSVQLTDGM